ncbi:MAG: hypothetical protein MJ072_04315, partial [Clostridia bacterium]|nr:hypothetical protein [Clostridia bacterium]
PGVMKTVYVDELFDDYYYVTPDGKNYKYGVCGLDGCGIGPKFGETDGKQYITIATDTQNDVTRTDNDYAILLQFDIEEINKVAIPLDFQNPHTVSVKPAGRYFFYTGNMDYGIQVIEYDEYTKKWFFICYPSSKPNFPKAYTFTVNAEDKPVWQKVKGQLFDEEAYHLVYDKDATLHTATGITYWTFWQANTGFISLGDGTYLVSNSQSTGSSYSDKVDTWRFTAKQPTGFELVTSRN